MKREHEREALRFADSLGLLLEDCCSTLRVMVSGHVDLWSHMSGGATWHLAKVSFARVGVNDELLPDPRAVMEMMRRKIREDCPGKMVVSDDDGELELLVAFGLRGLPEMEPAEMFRQQSY